MFLRYKFLFLSGFTLFCIAVYIFMFSNLDLALSHFFILSPSDYFLPFVRFISDTGSFLVVMPLTGLLALWLYFKRSLLDAVWVVGTLVSCRVVFTVLKVIVERHRPVFPEPLVHAVSASFPSGHSVNSLTFLLVCYIIFNQRISVLCLSIIWAVAIGWSRLALGAHWTSDVLAGWGCGFMWIAIAYQVKGSVYFQKILTNNALSKSK